MQVRQGDVDGCGFQLRSLPANLNGARASVLLDVSLNLYANYLALMKGGAAEITLSQGAPTRRKSLPITGFWLKLAGGKATVPRGNKVIPAEDAGYLLYGSEFPLLAELFYAVLEGKELSIGVKLKGESTERIYVGTAGIEEAERKQSSQCMEELVARMRAELDAEQKKSEPK
jgi:hypothetical protein